MSIAEEFQAALGSAGYTFERQMERPGLTLAVVTNINDPDKLKEASPSQITTALGTLIDKWAPKGTATGGQDSREDDPITQALRGKYGDAVR